MRGQRIVDTDLTDPAGKAAVERGVWLWQAKIFAESDHGQTEGPGLPKSVIRM